MRRIALRLAHSVRRRGVAQLFKAVEGAAPAHLIGVIEGIGAAWVARHRLATGSRGTVRTPRLR